MTFSNISRRQSLQIGLLGGLSTMLAPRISFAAQTWDMPAAYSAGNFISKSYVSFSEKVAEKSSGELQITVHAGGSLYGGSDILRAVREGQVQIGARFLAPHAAEAPVLGVDTVPFLATDRDEARRLYEASRPYLEAALEERGLKLLFAPIWPPQGLFSAKPVSSVADMEGVRFRAYDGSTTRLAELMGAVPTKTEADGIAQAFSTGQAEAMTASGAIGVFQKIWDYVNYFYTINAWMPKSGVIVNLDAWNGLDDATRAAVLEASAETEAAVWDEMEVQNAGYIETMKENGMKVEAPSDELINGLRQIGATMAEEWAASAGEVGEKVLAAYRG
ncbi:TRAP transporter substrate-binding protein [Roseovarius sp. E0-M6]|uniref:TRAP transporter substrate-binding protein n=1 Tax=Roseovarius sp. E0-M6 TaxID=3127118 RepID=UPI00300F80E0